MKELLKKILPKNIGIYYFFLKQKFNGAFLLKGNERYCNLCDSSFNKFSPFGRRDDVLCPNCFSLERHRLLFSYFQSKTKILTKNKSILHFAPEKCLYHHFRNNSGYVTADLMIQHIPCLEVKPKKVMSVLDIEFEDNSFDYIICNHVLEHVVEDIKAMKELFRVLKKGGTAFLQVPINNNSDSILEDLSLTDEERQRQYGYKDHVRFYSEKGYKKRLESVGFKLILSDHVRHLDIERLRLNRSEKIFICNKGK